MNHVSATLEGKISDKTIVDEIAEINRNPIYANLPLEGKAQQLLASKLKNMSIAVSGKSFPPNRITNYDLTFFKTTGIINKRTYEYLAKFGNLVQLPNKFLEMPIIKNIMKGLNLKKGSLTLPDAD